jgi:hypothetical protein
VAAAWSPQCRSRRSLVDLGLLVEPPHVGMLAIIDVLEIRLVPRFDLLSDSIGSLRLWYENAAAGA